MKKLFLLLLSGILSVSVTACSKSHQDMPYENNVDYSDVFGDIKGCCVFYKPNNSTYLFYNEKECKTRYSPNSTFKIVATCEGLENSVVTSENSKMNYNGTNYPFESWNRNLNLKDAFQSSCVWYYRQMIDLIGKNNMKKGLDELNYGNCDISQWEGSGAAPTKDTNGFWLGSSLEISPYEMVNVLKTIFNGESRYSDKNIKILKGIMKSDVDGVYGKTGTGRDNSAWYVGFYENDDQVTYFALHLENGSGKNIAGADAKKIAVEIIDKYYR